jgi:hypothetical protein
VTGWALLTTLHTRLIKAYSQVLMDSVIGFLEANGHLVARVVSASRALRLRAPLERVPASKHLGKDVGAKATGEALVLRSIRVSELVKVLALLGVGQDVVGALDLLKLFSISRWFIWMMLKGKFAIGLLDLVIAGTFGDP